MHFTHDDSCCPVCKHTFLVRRRRRLWMRIIGIDKFLTCEACHAELLFRVGRPPKKTGDGK